MWSYYDAVALWKEEGFDTTRRNEDAYSDERGKLRVRTWIRVRRAIYFSTGLR